MTFEQWFPSQNHVLDIIEHIILMNLHVWKWFYDSISHQAVVGFTKLTKSVNKMTLLPFIWDHFRFFKSVKSSTAVKFNHLILKLSSRWPRKINFIILLLNYLIIIKLKLFNINVQNVVSSCQNHNNNLAAASKLLDLQSVGLHFCKWNCLWWVTVNE